MALRIETMFKPEFDDPKARTLLERLKSDYSLANLKDIRRVQVYSSDSSFSEGDSQFLAKEVFTDPVCQLYSIGKPAGSSFSLAIEVGYRPGVKDTLGETSKIACEDALKRELNSQFFSSTIYLFYGEGMRGELAAQIAEKILCNTLIEQYKIFKPSQIEEYYSNLSLPVAGAQEKGQVEEIALPNSPKELEKLSKRRLLSLSVEEMRQIAGYYKKPKTMRTRQKLGLPENPTDVEIECIAQTWSEHCKHKIFNAEIIYTEKQSQKNKTAARKKIVSLFKTYISSTTKKITQAQSYLLSVFSDNAGIMAINKDWALAIKAETHNSPSALDPFGGALTGILGVNRDIIGAGLGAKPIFNTDVFCFADPNYKGKIPPKLHHPKRVYEGVRSGVELGGNASGIPTINGSIVFDDRYLGKPLVYCGTGGIMPRRLKDGREAHIKMASPKDRIFMVGGRIGKDGIHGATFSSAELNETSPTSAVQLGDPFTQKIVLDFLMESRERCLYSALTDNGAGGLSSSIGEMATLTNGALVHLERAPLKYPGLNPWEIFVSESQERMTVAVPPKNAGEFAALAKTYGVEATDIGEFTKDGYLRVLNHTKTVACLELRFLHKGLPKMKLRATYSQKEKKKNEPPQPKDLSVQLHKILSRLNVCSKESVVRQYDHEVLGMNSIKPLCGVRGSGPSDAAMLQPFPDKYEAIFVSHGICPKFSDYDAYDMAQLAVDEAVRNYVATGGDPARWGALDNFCWPDPIKSKSNP
ncbi:MAG: AIR synthase-related protein, partial [Candidatus Micrarchaeota archaeon]